MHSKQPAITIAKKSLSYILLALFFISFSFVIFAQNVQAQVVIPKYQGPVNDFEEIITNDQELEDKILLFYEQTGVEIAVVTVEEFTGATSIEEYAVKLFEEWGIGDKETDTGVLVLVSQTQRQSRIEVGYGLEGVLNDAKTGRIQDQYMIPYFKDGDFNSGINEGVDALILELQGESILDDSEDSTSGSEFDSEAFFDIFLFFGFIFFSIIVNTKSWWFGGVIGFITGIFFGLNYFSPWGVFVFPIPFAIIGLIADFILSKIFAYANRGGRTGTGAFISSRGSSGSSGGGFSFGGGSSGGGGSSRSW